MRLRERLGPLGREPWIVLAPLVVAQWVAVAVFTTFVNHNGWLFYQGGDQSWFYTSGWMLAQGHVPETFVGWLWPVVMAPITVTFGPNYLSGVPAVVLVQFLLLLPLGALCCYAVAARIGGRLLGYWAAAWWVAVPYLTIPLFVDRYHDRYVDQTLPQAFGLSGLGDFPSMIAVLAAAVFFARALESHDWLDVLATGLLTGIAVGIKPANGLFVLAPFVGFAVARRWRAALQFGLVLLPALLVLALWKHRGSGIALLAFEPVRLAAAETPDFAPPTFWERLRDYVPLDREQLQHQFVGFREYFWSARLLQFLPLAGVLAVARRSLPLAAFLGVWLGTFFLVKGSSQAVNVETGSFWRLLMPAWPAYFLLGASLPLLVPRVGAALAERFHDPLRPLRRGRRAIVAASVAALAIPALAFAVLPPDDTRRAAQIQLRSLFLPIDPTFRIAGAAREEGELELTWAEPEGMRARPFYVLLRSPSRYLFPPTGGTVERGVLCREPGGAIRCTLEMDEVVRTRARLYRDRPPRGQWTYRVGVAANWVDDMEQGDIVLLSEPIDVDVR
jgi:hypothetical protein